MKIEMGESLFYSWLRHIRGCQLVQTNWKASPTWPLYNEARLVEIMQRGAEFFSAERSLDIIGRTRKLSQFLRQAEIDALGIATGYDRTQITAVDVAFHTNGLHYGTPDDTVEKVLEKCIRNDELLWQVYIRDDDGALDVLLSFGPCLPQALRDVFSLAQSLHNS